MKYQEMHIDEMKQVKDSWKSHLKTFSYKLNHVKCVKETKENRWELMQLEELYSFCIDYCKKIIAKYSNLIDLAENCDLEEHYFLKEMKEVQKLHETMRKELNKKSNKLLEIKYIESLRPAKVINI